MLITFGFVTDADCAPRPLVPPYPSFGAMFREGFDQPYGFGTNQAIDPAVWAESWSGWALNRQGSVVAPWVVPMVVSNSFRVEPERGAIRFWYQPDFNSGAGPGQEATLLTLVTAQGKTAEVWWALVVTPDGGEVRLVCQTENGPESCLSAEVEWAAGSWHLLTLGFTPTNSALFIDDQIAAVGEGLGPIPNEAAPFTSLIVGSDAAGNATARGQVEELYIFSGRKRMQQIMGNPFGLSVDWEIGTYYSALSQIAALGPISEEEVAARRAQAEKRKAEREALELEEGSSSQMLRFAGYTSECVTNAPLYITNTVCVFDTNTAWTVTFDIQGTNGPVDIFVTTNLSDHLTNSHWVWLERGPSCSTYQYTNQPESQAFFILGTPTDNDGDGLTDAYELLVSKTLVSTNDTDADGIPDAWEVAHGLNPLWNDASEDPDADGLTNYQEYLANSDPQVGVMVVAWGRNSSGQCNVPAGLRDVVAVAGGEKSSFALKRDGTVVAWGGNALGETNLPIALTNATAIVGNGYASCSTPTGIGLALSNGVVISWGTNLGNPPSGLSGVSALAVGAFHSLALKSNGTVVSWGNTNQWAARVPAGLANVKAITTGWHHSAALLSNGTVTAWGLYAPELGYTLTNVPAGLSDVAAISAYGLHTLALRSNGTVVAWGYNQAGQTNVPSGLSNIVAVVAGAGHNLALKNDGTVAAWGFLSGAPALLDKVTAIAAGQDHALVVRTGKLTPIILKNPVDWQQTNGGMVSFGVNVASLAPVSYQWQSNTVNLSGATNATLTLSNVQVSATYRVLVANSAGFVQSSNAALQIIVAGPPVIQTVTPPPGVVWIKSFTSLAVSATAVGQELDPIYQCRYQWKSNGVPIPGQTLSFFFLSIGTDPATLAGDYSVTVTNAVGGTNVGPWRLRAVVTGSVVGWGAADSDLLNVPAGATNITALAASLTHSLLVREDGTTLAWGRNDYGETNVPPTLTNTVAVAGGINHSLALRSDGTVVAWGRNHVGQTNVPSGLTNVTSIAGAGNYSLALLRNGTVTNWGETYGNIPANLTNATAIAAGRNFSLALRSNGTVVAWGANDFGQTNLPSGLTNVVAIAAGGFHALALRENGTVLAWGSVSNAPADLTNALTIAAGWSHNAAIRNNGRVVSWGDNTYGQTNSTSGLSDVKLLAAGGDHTLVSIFSPLVQYPVDVTKDLLLIYNATSTNSIVVKDYYLAHRPMVSGANTMGINCTTNELIDIATFTNQILPAILDWLTNNPTKRPQYIILFPDLPTRVWETLTCTNYCRLMSVAFGLHTNFPGLKPFVTSINMGLHDLTNDCIAYINKLAAFGTNGQLFISASKGGYGNTNFVVDNVRHGSGYSPSYAPWGSYVFSATNGLSEAGVSPGEISYLAGNETRETNELGGWFYHDLYHITNAANVAGYISWGAHSSLGNEYARFGPIRVKWTGNSAWWIIETIESFNGHRATGQGNFTQWFSTDAFGGTGYENTPIGAVSHTDEPGLGGVNDSRLLFGLWAQGKIFAISGWNSRMTRFFQAVGDPFTTK